MIKSRLINFVKTNNYIYDIYYYIGSFILKFIGIFVKVKPKTILFVSFGGKGFNDSPKALYDYIVKDSYFDSYELVWAFRNPEKYSLKRGRAITIDTFEFFKIALSSKYWISNSAVERGLNFKQKSTYYINTWHGTPLKRIKSEANNSSNKTGLGSKDNNTEDLMLAQSHYDAKIFSRIFNIDLKDILISDLPRNDYLKTYDNKDLASIKNKIGVSTEKKIILYAPTYRDYLRDSSNNAYISPPINQDKWEKKLGGEFVILFRAHYEISKLMRFDNSLFIDVSNYENLNELMIVSDLLISDYSSIFIDYSILEKPMLCFAYDLDEYLKNRGLYIDLKLELPCEISKKEGDILRQIKTIDYESSSERSKRFRQKYAPNSGCASKAVVNKIKEVNIKN